MTREVILRRAVGVCGEPPRDPRPLGAPLGLGHNGRRGDPQAERPGGPSELHCWAPPIRGLRSRPVAPSGKDTHFLDFATIRRNQVDQPGGYSWQLPTGKLITAWPLAVPKDYYNGGARRGTFASGHRPSAGLAPRPVDRLAPTDRVDQSHPVQGGPAAVGGLLERPNRACPPRIQGVVPLRGVEPPRDRQRPRRAAGVLSLNIFHPHGVVWVRCYRSDGSVTLVTSADRATEQAEAAKRPRAKKGAGETRRAGRKQSPLTRAAESTHSKSKLSQARPPS